LDFIARLPTLFFCSSLNRETLYTPTETKFFEKCFLFLKQRQLFVATFLNNGAEDKNPRPSSNTKRIDQDGKNT